MKIYFLSFWLINISFFAWAQDKIKVACVGNSITYGAGISNRLQSSYPAQLQNLLGKQYEVLNFGQSGATLLKNTNNPYWKTKAYQNALASNPNIVLIKLGTNDGKGPNRNKYNQFESNYKELIAGFRRLPSRPRIILLTPVASFMADTNQIADTVLKTHIIPMVQNVACTEKLEIIDLHPLFVDKEGMFPDKIHPDDLGASIIANRVYEAITQKTDEGFDIFRKINADKKYSSFYGFECADFKLNGRDCRVVKPRITAIDHPWIWRARFWGHQPQLDISLLERGFHVVYCDVAELFGNAEAVGLWNTYYDMMQKAGLSKKVALEGMSRGGIYIYNWALANPGKVACIYADAPVLDLKSWPGKKRLTGGKEPWEDFKKDYNLSDEQALKFNNTPLDNAEKMAKLGFPMLHVVGDADDVVPIADNTTPFEKRVLAAGGHIQVIHKPGVNHHPHSLQNPTPITDFILRNTGYKVNFATLPAPGAEYRSGAGWNNGKDWWAQHQSIDSLLQARPKLDVLFLGNSITQGIGGHRPYVTHKPGLSAFDSVFAHQKWESAGISGDRTQNILWRLQNGKYKESRPKVLVITIGVNNSVADGDTPTETVAGIREITNWVVANMSQTKLILLGPLPLGTKKDEQRRKDFEEIQRQLAKVKHQGYTYAPIIKPFLLANGDLDPRYYSKDGIHLVPEGYKVWAKALKRTIDQILSKK